MATKKDNTIEADFLGDFWDGYSGRCNSDPNQPHVPPDGWLSLTVATRQRICAVIAQGQPAGIRVNVWHRIRAHFLASADLGEGPAVGELLKPLFVTDAEERKRWRAAADEIHRAQLILMLDVAGRKFAQGRDERDSIIARRDGLNKMLDALDRMDLAAR